MVWQHKTSIIFSLLCHCQFYIEKIVDLAWSKGQWMLSCQLLNPSTSMWRKKQRYQCQRPQSLGKHPNLDWWTMKDILGWLISEGGHTFYMVIVMNHHENRFRHDAHIKYINVKSETLIPNKRLLQRSTRCMCSAWKLDTAAFWPIGQRAFYQLFPSPQLIDIKQQWPQIKSYP